MTKDDHPREGAPSNQQPPQGGATDKAIWDQNTFLRRVGNKPERVGMLLQMFVDSLPDQRHQLQQRIKEKSALEAAKIAHSLKGSAANLGANQLMKACSELELYLRKLHRALEQPVDANLSADFADVEELLSQALHQSDLIEAVFTEYLQTS